MLQAIVKKGKILSEKVPAPVISKGSVLIKVLYSCISAGTEVSSVEETKSSLIRKVIDRPGRLIKAAKLVTQVGLSKSVNKIKNIGNEGAPLGYSVSGIVLDVGEGVTEFEPGEQVAASGASIANHAEYVNVPKNLVMKCPSGIDMKAASTVTLGGIALQGVRRTKLSLGDICAVYGTGILGLLSVQLLAQAGVRVIAVDIDDRRLEIAKHLGAEKEINALSDDLLETVNLFTNGYGVDAVLFSANTASSEPLSQAFQMCKKKGKVVMLGKAELHIDRKDMYPKELDLLTSTSYGPGRYDTVYEEEGIDYPYAYVRWTEKRNLEEYLRLLDANKITVGDLIEKEYPIEEANEAFETIQNSDVKPLMVVLSYGRAEEKSLDEYSNHIRKVITHKPTNTKGALNVAFIGAGDFAKAMHIPNMKKMADKYNLYALLSQNSYNTKVTAETYGFEYCTTNLDEILSDPKVDIIFITSNHGSHAEYVLRSLKSGKHVFVEKPLAINQVELNQIKEFYANGDSSDKPIVAVGYNRRFSKYVDEIVKHTRLRNDPLFIHYRMNAGYKQAESKIFKEGGRIIGEGCHIIDLMSHIVGSEIKSISFESLTPSSKKFLVDDNKSIVLKYKDGSVCSLQYFAIGNKAVEKEYMEVHFDSKSIFLHDYKEMKAYGVDLKEIKSEMSEKGHIEELEILYDYLTGKQEEWPIDLKQLIETSEATFAIVNE
jgi:predicted dehydrogenase/threonine dehydrogenase-like Zn-dependent dehydrogenase